MKKLKEKNKPAKGSNTLIKFLRQTKEGEYAPVEKTSLQYSRLDESVESVNVPEDIYHYGLS